LLLAIGIASTFALTIMLYHGVRVGAWAWKKLRSPHA
jgi:hypothetical protein